MRKYEKQSERKRKYDYLDDNSIFNGILKATLRIHSRKQEHIIQLLSTFHSFNLQVNGKQLQHKTEFTDDEYWRKSRIAMIPEWHLEYSSWKVLVSMFYDSVIPCFNVVNRRILCLCRHRNVFVTITAQSYSSLSLYKHSYGIFERRTFYGHFSIAYFFLLHLQMRWKTHIILVAIPNQHCMKNFIVRRNAH